MPAAAPKTQDAIVNSVSLDALPYEAVVEASVRCGLAALARALPPSDLAILGQLRAYWMPTRPGQGLGSLVLPAEAKQAIPVAAALLEWNRIQPGPALTCLTAVLMNLALGPEGQDPSQRRFRIPDLARIIRNAIEKPGADLRSLIAGAATVTSLARLLDQEVEGGSQIHLTFNQLWSNWLRHRVARWVMAEPSRLRQALGPPPELIIDLDAPQLPLWGDDSAADDQVEWSGTEVSGSAFEGLGARAAHGLANAHSLLRRSGESPLSLHPDHLVPEDLVKHVARKTLEAGRAALANENLTQAEPYLALGLQIASGFREMDLAGVHWGRDVDQGDAVLLIEAPVLSLRVRRPPHAVVPPLALAPHLKQSSNRMYWPVPPSLHQLLKGLAGTLGPAPGVPVLPIARLGEPYYLRSTLAELAPGAHFGAGRFRLALAANIADRWGPEVAQLAMRDTFSTSLGPAYYTAVPEAALAQTISSVLGTWFGEQVPSAAGRDGHIGSRLALTDDFARQWPTRLRKSAYAAARLKDGWRAHLAAERNLLAAALCAATGIRPGNCIGSVHLDSVIPEFGLVILEDKLVDVLRRTRVAVTGWRWTAELRSYLDRLVDLAQHPEQPVAAWANAVLRSEQPLFSLPKEGGGAKPLGMDELLRTMPEPMGDVANHYRHRLNQRLMEKGVDWELRHAQLGWVVTPSFALADLSPLSARMLGARLGDVVDDMLMEDGWYANRKIPKWSWRGVPERPLKDWDAELRRYESEHADHVRGVREEFNTRRKDVEAQVLPRLATAVAEVLPALRLDVAARSLGATPGYLSREPVALSIEHYLLLRDRVRKSDQEPGSALESLAAEYLIHDIVSKAIRAKVVSGPLPPRRHLGATAQLSPFMPGLGLAVRHAEALRDRLAHVASKSGARDRPGVTQMAVMAGTPFRDFESAAAATASASGAVRGARKRDWLCVPAMRDRKESPMVFGGVVAALLARRAADAPTAKALSRDQLSAWLEKRFADVPGCGDDIADRVERVAATFQMAGRLELSGPERLVMDGQRVACVDTTRSLAIRDEWPLRTADPAQETPGPTTRVREVLPCAGDPQQPTDRKVYFRLTAALNSAVSRSASGRKSDGKHGWRGRLAKELRRLTHETEASPNIRLLVEYASHRLRHGGRRISTLSQGTLHKEVTRFGNMLLDVLGRRSLLLLGGQEIQSTYLAVLVGKPEATRADVLEELVKFHRYLESVHHAPDVDFAPLRSFVGGRVRSLAPGALSNAEVHRVLDELMTDLDHERCRPDAGPLEVRACALRVLAFILLEASGARPSSIHGLTLGDLHFLGDCRDFLHIHRTGEYGEAKTLASVGFVRLEGDIWEKYRDWVLTWVSQERALSGLDWWKRPVFADSAESRRRFDRPYLTDRIGQLLKWATSEPKARVYWLRKRRITARMEAALENLEAVPRVVYRAMREAGHTGIGTTLANYVHDASVPLRSYLRWASSPDRAAIIDSTGLQANALDQAWHRSRRSGNLDFLGVVLDRLGATVAARPDECVTNPPALYRQKGLAPAHIDLYARARQHFSEPEEAQAHSGISALQAEALERAASELLVRTGAAPWKIDGVRQSRGVMAPARRLSGTEGLFALMEAKVDPWFDTLLEAWLEQGYTHRLYPQSVLLVLRTPDQLQAAHDLIVATQPHLQIASDGGTDVLAASNPGGAERSAHGSALRWVFAMCWLCQRLADEAGST